MNKFGQLYNVFSDDDVKKWVQTLKITEPVVIKGNLCHGVDKNNTVFYQWFMKNIFSKIQEIFNDDLVLLFGMYLVENAPWGIHTDAYHVETRPGMIPAYSMLIPYSVDFDTNLVTKSQTIVFNEEIDNNSYLMQLPLKVDDPNCALKIYESCLDHNSKEIVSRVTIAGQCNWEPGSLIYWQSQMLHDTKNFLTDGFKSKQAIVIHTGYQA